MLLNDQLLVLTCRAHLSQGVAAGNVFQTKMKLQDDMDIAWEAYKELQQQGSEEEKAEAYKKWEDLKRQVAMCDEGSSVHARARLG